MNKKHPAYRWTDALLMITIILLAVGCVGSRMSVEEAKEVAITIEKEPFIPPPRRAYDVLAVLEQRGKFNPKIVARHKTVMESPPPQTDDPETLAEFYLKRGNSAMEFGYPHRAVEDVRKALLYAEQVKHFKKMGGLLFRLGQAELLVGNFKQGVEMLERSQKKGKGAAYNELVKIYSLIGDIETAGKYLRAGTRELDDKIQKSKREKTKDKKDMKKVSRRVATTSQMKAWYLEGQGKFADAEPYIRSALSVEEKQKKRSPGRYISSRISLGNNLMMQGRKYEAEVEVRKALDSALGFGGRDSILTAEAVNSLGNVVLTQGRMDEAEKLVNSSLDILEQCGVSRESQIFSDALIVLGDVLTTKQEFNAAANRFDSAAKGVYAGPSLYDRLHRNPNFILSLIQIGRLDEALKIVKAVYELEKKLFGTTHPSTLEIIALRGMIRVKERNNEAAYKDFSGSVPLLLERKIDEENYAQSFRLKLMGEAYLELLSDLNGSSLEARLGVDAVSEAFRLADALGGRTIQRSLGASSARTAVTDPKLADLARKEQDAQKQMEVLQLSLSNMMAAPGNQQIPSVVKDLQNRIDKLRKAQKALYREIGKRFPKYSDFTHPRPGTVSSAQEKLLPGESLIAVYTSEKNTYVWAIPYKGSPAFSKTSMGIKEMVQTIAGIRKTFSPDLNTFGDMPQFDVMAAYGLFEKILLPVKEGWKNASDLLVVVYGPMGQIPLGMLPTEPVRLGPEKDLLFSNYRSIPWLIRKASVTKIPSASSLLMLRSLPAVESIRKAFFGFGNPVFNLTQLSDDAYGKDGALNKDKNQFRRLQSRGFRKKSDASVDVDTKTLSSFRLEDLERLPDTEEEIKHIAMALDADPEEDTLLREDASENKIKALDLSDRRVVAFATHALKPGDLDGLDQPALAMTTPTVTGESDDGLLTAGEIYNLRLNADWVVLSACSTGIDESFGAESVSGLGRAFFYAGTRSLLVTMWPVETTSARILTTGLFSYQKKDNTMSRAKALQKAMLDLIDGPGFVDQSSGKTVSSYAHPFFWAPFIIIGDNGNIAH
ncbi:MAG TPA: CHAT domain-containing protein [Deltaproteobacteria bacterium]|nr:CHAT domain-containing protein [Deltaproteobacteria bacterium]